MTYDEFSDILNKKIFLASKADLIRKFAEYPERYIGLFRPTKPKGKIIQNLTQSAEIKFGDAFEEIIEKYFTDFGFEQLPKILKKEGKKFFALDQLFIKDEKIIFIEQKIRDDHDSTKKVGQIGNFIRKIEILQDEYPNNQLEAIFYFIDNTLSKNKNYYNQEIEKINDDYGISCSLLYGKELFDKYDINVWDEIIEHLIRWKKSIPELPEINYEINLEQNFEEIKNVEPSKFRKIFNNETIFNEMILTITPNKLLLYKLLDHFRNEYETTNKKIYKTLFDILNKKLH